MEEAASKAIKDSEILSALLEGITSKKDEIRFNSYHILLNISEHNPAILSPKWDYLADLLTSHNQYSRYVAINLLANLVKVDTEKKFEACFDRYFDIITGKKTMVAGQATLNAGKIAKAKPNLQTKITNTLLKVDRIHRGRQTELMKAYAIEALNDYVDEIADKEKIIDFVKAQLASDSPKTRKAAKVFLECNRTRRVKALQTPWQGISFFVNKYGSKPNIGGGLLVCRYESTLLIVFPPVPLLPRL